MQKNILYIFEKINGVKQKSNLSFRDEVDKLFLCPVTVDKEYISFVEKKMAGLGYANIIKIPYIEKFHKTAFNIKNNFIQFISEFGDKSIGDKKSIKEYFKYPFECFSIWWFSLIAEKNTLKSDSYAGLVKLVTILDIIKDYSCDEVWIDGLDPRLIEVLEENSEQIRFVCCNRSQYKKRSSVVLLIKTLKESMLFLASYIHRVILIKRAMSELKKSRRPLAQNKHILVTYFPLFDDQAWQKDIFIDKYYRPLQDELERNFKEEFAWIAIAVCRSGLKIKEISILGRQANKFGQTLFFPEEWIGLRNILWGVVVQTYLSIKFLIKAKSIAKIFRFSHNSKKLIIWPLFKKDWYESFCGRILMNGIFNYEAFNEMNNDLSSSGALLTYLMENHAWEKALNIALRQKKHFTVIGIQHSIMPLLMLNYFNHPDELCSEDNIHGVPRPDYLGCVGEITTDLLRQSGWEEERTFVWGAIRFQHFPEDLDQTVNWCDRKKEIVVALSINPNESAELLGYIRQAFSQCSGFRVLIKPHPFLSLDRLLESLDIELNPAIFEIVDVSLNKLFNHAKAAIICESSASLESIACGCPVVIPRLISTIDLSPLSGLSNLAMYVDDTKQLRRTIEEIINKKSSPLSLKQRDDFIHKYCFSPDSNSKFLQGLELLRKK